MKNYIQPGEILDLYADGTGVKSGEGWLFGTIFGVATTDTDLEGNLAKTPFAIRGVFSLPRTGGAIGQGSPCYWDATAKKVTGTKGTNRCIGAAAEGSGDAATHVQVYLPGITTL